MTRKLSRAAVDVWARLIRAEHALLEAVEADLKAAGLPPLVWYDVALELARAPNGRLRHRDLNARVLLAKYNLSRLIDRMVEAGLVARLPVAEDARGAYIAITEAGRRLQKRVWPVYGRSIARHFVARLDERDLTELDRILAKLRAAAPQGCRHSL
jgi:DNA-binding MarR family transcriptional regulator